MEANEPPQKKSQGHCLHHQREAGLPPRSSQRTARSPALPERRRLLPGAGRRPLPPRCVTSARWLKRRPLFFFFSFLPFLLPGPASRKSRWVRACGSGVRGGRAPWTLASKYPACCARASRFGRSQVSSGPRGRWIVRAEGNRRPLRPGASSSSRACRGPCRTEPGPLAALEGD